MIVTYREMLRWSGEDIAHGQRLIAEADGLTDPRVRLDLYRRGMDWIRVGERWAERAIEAMQNERKSA